MNILIFSYNFPPDIGAGSFRISALADELALNEEVKSLTVITATPNRYNTHAPRWTKNDKEHYKIVRFWVPRLPSKFIFSAIAYSFFFIQALIYSVFYFKKINIVFATSSRSMTIFLGSLVSYTKRAELIIDIRDIFSETLPEILFKKNNNLGLFIQKIFKRFEIYSINRASRVIQVSPMFFDYYKVHSSKWTTATNGIDKIFLESRYKESHEVGKNEEREKYNIVYAGNVGAAQCLDKIIPQVAMQRPNFHFHVYGSGSGLSSMKIASKSQNIHLHEPIPREELIPIYQTADLLFLHLDELTAFKRVLPSKIFEYAVYNKPIVAGLQGYVVDFIKENLNGFFIFTPNDVQGCILSIEKALEFTSEIDNNNFSNYYSRKNQVLKMVNCILEN